MLQLECTCYEIQKKYLILESCTVCLKTAKKKLPSLQVATFISYHTILLILEHCNRYIIKIIYLFIFRWIWTKWANFWYWISPTDSIDEPFALESSVFYPKSTAKHPSIASSISTGIFWYLCHILQWKNVNL